MEGRLAPTVTLSVSNPTPFPKPDTGQVQGMFVVTRSGDMAPAVQVDYATQDGTGSNAARAGVDYTATSGTLYFAANQATATINVPILGNTIFQADKTFTVSLSSPLPSASFAPQQTFATGTQPFGVAVGDFNGDGKPDLAITNRYSNTVSVLLNTTAAGASAPSFAAQQTFAVGGNPVGVAVGDFNGDGRPDLAVTNYGSATDTVSVLLNTTAAGASAPSFAPQQTFTVVTGPWLVAVGDFNGDGKPDLAITDRGSNTVSVLLNTRVPISAPVNFTGRDFAAGATPFSVAVGDFNGDGKPDLAVTNGFYRGGGASVSVLLNTTAPGASVPSFAPPLSFSTGVTPWSVAVGDFNGDGKPDLAVANAGSGTVSVLLNITATGATTPSFAPQQTFAPGNSCASVVVADVNGDGKPDLAVANNGSATVLVLINTTAPGASSASFAPPQTFASGGGSHSVAVGDFNGDGKPDLAVIAGGVSVLLNTTPAGATTASFSPVQTFATEANPGTVVVGDFNGDGRPDLATTSYGGAPMVSVLLNTTAAGATSPSFAPVRAFGPSGFAGPLQFLAAGDFNNDGKLDLAATNGDANSYFGVNVTVLSNATAAGATSPSFGNISAFQVPDNLPEGVAVGDFNGDGKADLAVANQAANTVSVLVNEPAPFTLRAGTGTISSAPETPTSVTVVAGSSGQSAVVATAFAVPLAVDVRDAANFLVQGVSVTFTAPTSGASGQFGGSNTATVVSNASGRATAPTFTAGTVAGTYTVRAQAAGGSNPSTTISLTNTAGPPATIAAVSGGNQSATVKAAFANPLVVRVQDQYGNLAPGVSVTFTGPGYGPAAVFTGGATATTDGNGVATKAFSANEAAGFYLLTATVAGGSNPSTYFLNFTNVPDVPAYLLATGGGNQSAAVNTSFATPLLATVIDQYGNPVPGVAVTFTAPAGGAGATFPNGNTATTNANGLVVVPITANTVAGSYGITAVVNGGRNPVTTFVNLTNTPGAADHLRVTTTAANPDVAGTPFDVTVTAQDVYGNTATGYRGTVHFSSADPYSATLPADYSFQAADAGVHTFAGGAALYTAGTWDVTAADTGGSVRSSASVNVQAAPAAAFQVIAPATAQAGTAFDVTVVAVDPYGNTDTNYQGTITWTTTDTDPRVVLPPDYTFGPGDQGRVTFPAGVTLYTPGDQTLTVTDTGSGFTGSGTVTVTTGPDGSGRRRLKPLADLAVRAVPLSQPLAMARTAAIAVASLDGDIAAEVHRRLAVEPWDARLIDDLVQSLLM